MESLSFQQMQVVEDQLQQISKAIHQLQEWNAGIASADDWLLSPDGMKTLAANCMLIEAIGEGFKKIDDRTQGWLLKHRNEIPWKQVVGMRNHIAHGYFDINTDFVWDVIKNDLQPLADAVSFFLENLYKILPVSQQND